MQQATKQRIVGSVVLIALALIFLPLIFDGEGSYEPEITSRIPPRPIVESLVPQLPTRPVIRANQPDFQQPTDSSEDSEEVAADAAVAASEDPTTASQPDSPSNEVATPETTEQVAEVVNSQPSFVRETPQLGPDGLPQGWSVRLGTFSDSANADALLSRLLAAGYKAYARELEREQGVLTAVFVGPWLDRNRVDQYLKELQSEFQLAGIVEKYAIDAP